MKIKSPVFLENQMIPSIYTCDGKNINPPLEFSEVPEDAESLALIVDDPDAATDPKGPGKTYDHWLVWNIDPKTSRIEEGAVPQGAREGLNGSRSPGYTGPCPPTGVHKYYFKLYALKKRLDLTPNIIKNELEQSMEGAIIEEAQLVGLYKH